MDSKFSLNSDRPECSVCIANYNGMGIIDDCIQSILNQDCHFKVEIIVHDDASTDGSAEHIRTAYPLVNLIESKKNVGFCISNNRMVEKARGDYIFLFNNDAVLFPDGLRVLHDFAKNHGKPAILSLPQYDAETEELIDRGSFFDLFLNPIPNLDPTRLHVGMVMGACFWIPRRLWDELGGFPEWFGSMAEDMYLCCLARLWGYDVIALKESGFRHWVGYSFGGGKIKNNRIITSYARRSRSETNKTFVMLMCYPWQILIIIFPIHIMFLFIEGILLSIVKKDCLIFQVIYAKLFSSMVKFKFRLYKYRTSNMKKKNKLFKFIASFQFMHQKIKLLFNCGVPNLK